VKAAPLSTPVVSDLAQQNDKSLIFKDLFAIFSDIF